MSCTTTCRKPNGNQAHCGAAGCHRTFSTVANFDKHRTGDAEHRHCADPATVGLRLGTDQIWRGEPGTWRPRPQLPEDAQTAEPASAMVASGSGGLNGSEALSGGADR